MYWAVFLRQFPHNESSPHCLRHYSFVHTTLKNYRNWHRQTPYYILLKIAQEEYQAQLIY